MKRIFRPLIPFSSVGFFKEIVGRYPKPKELYEFQQYIKQLEKQGLLDRNRWAQTFRPAWEVKAVHKYFEYLKENIYKSSRNVLTRIPESEYCLYVTPYSQEAIDKLTHWLEKKFKKRR